MFVDRPVFIMVNVYKPQVITMTRKTNETAFKKNHCKQRNKKLKPLQNPLRSATTTRGVLIKQGLILSNNSKHT